MEDRVVYFEEFGAKNTEETLRLAAERAQARGISKIVLASTRGETAKLAARLWADKGIRMIVIPHQFGFLSKKQRFTPELVADLQKQGHIVHFGTMLFHTDKFYGTDTPHIMANLLRTFCQGFKVCYEILLMATDAGHVDIGEQVVVVAGTGLGADTALVAIAATSTHLEDLHITEVICKPLQTKQGPPPPLPPE